VFPEGGGKKTAAQVAAAVGHLVHIKIGVPEQKRRLLHAHSGQRVVKALPAVLLEQPRKIAGVEPEDGRHMLPVDRRVAVVAQILQNPLVGHLGFGEQRRLLPFQPGQQQPEESPGQVRRGVPAVSVDAEQLERAQNAVHLLVGSEGGVVKGADFGQFLRPHPLRDAQIGETDEVGVEDESAHLVERLPHGMFPAERRRVEDVARTHFDLDPFPRVGENHPFDAGKRDVEEVAALDGRKLLLHFRRVLREQKPFAQSVVEHMPDQTAERFPGVRPDSDHFPDCSDFRHTSNLRRHPRFSRKKIKKVIFSHIK